MSDNTEVITGKSLCGVCRCVFQEDTASVAHSQALQQLSETHAQVRFVAVLVWLSDLLRSSLRHFRD